MRILHIAPDFEPKWGGVYQSVSGLVNALKKDARITLFTTYREKTERENISGVEQISIETNWKYQFSFEIKKKIAELVPQHDLVHIHGLWQFPLSYAAHVARGKSIPYVYHIHGMLNPWPLQFHSWRKTVYAALRERANLNDAARIVCVAKREEESVRRFGVTAKTTVIPNGVSHEEIDHLPARGNFRRKHKGLADKFLILFLGRIHPKKGADLLIRAFSRIQTNLPRTHLIIAGPEEKPEYATALRNLIQTERLENQVTFVGPVYGTAKKELLIDCDLFALSSKDEAFSIAILEAMAAGLPVVVTKECSFDEIGSSESGLVVVYGEKELSDAIQKIASDEWLAKRMGVNGRNLVSSRYEWSLIGKQVLELYEKIINR